MNLVLPIQGKPTASQNRKHRYDGKNLALSRICRRGTAPVRLLYIPEDCRCRAPTVLSIYLKIAVSYVQQIVSWLGTDYR
ncbi:hypothetical protein H6G33_29770 [Calothrix sp. FACHB-1219]|uniref:hypothetical protein n=1 Tax=unclassified Calothrix TaxID=2619626 RepID=UPI00168203CD|nr:MULTISPECIES: hypothetical protein [unclassified Calothrix]MBD2203556.1 hypothetical protein [Calothrix sp. FACHB-168]MBD2221167.1 hypothetical protein [Calothrix sp. FACHB-1219]